MFIKGILNVRERACYVNWEKFDLPPHFLIIFMNEPHPKKQETIGTEYLQWPKKRTKNEYIFRKIASVPTSTSRSILLPDVCDDRTISSLLLH